VAVYRVFSQAWLDKLSQCVSRDRVPGHWRGGGCLKVVAGWSGCRTSLLTAARFKFDLTPSRVVRHRSWQSRQLTKAQTQPMANGGELQPRLQPEREQPLRRPPDRPTSKARITDPQQ
jgi:hypothetical protein